MNRGSVSLLIEVVRAKLTRTILQRSIAHTVKNAQGAVNALAVSATSDRTKSVIDGFRKAFLDTEEGEA